MHASVLIDILDVVEANAAADQASRHTKTTNVPGVPDKDSRGRRRLLLPGSKDVWRRAVNRPHAA